MCRAIYPSRSIVAILILFIGLSSALIGSGAEKNPSTPARKPAQNKLTAAERRGGWRLLFDGKSTAGWRSFKKTTFPEKGWVLVDECLKHLSKAGGGDIITIDRFQEFDLKFEWKIAPGANSGLKYFITEDRSGAIGHEYQVIDEKHDAESLRGGKWQTGGLYDCLPPKADKKLKPPGEFNTSRILVRAKRVEHWLNGEKILDFELESPELKAAVAQSKFKTVEGFGTSFPGHILLQDHGDEVCFRNIKIKNLATH